MTSFFYCKCRDIRYYRISYSLNTLITLITIYVYSIYIIYIFYVFSRSICMVIPDFLCLNDTQLCSLFILEIRCFCNIFKDFFTNRNIFLHSLPCYWINLGKTYMGNLVGLGCSNDRYVCAFSVLLNTFYSSK